MFSPVHRILPNRWNAKAAPGAMKRRKPCYRAQLRKSAIITLVGGFMCLANMVQATDISVLGSWSVLVIEGVTTYESNPDQILLTISNAPTKHNGWNINVAKSDIHWDSRLLLWIQRTGDGVGAGMIRFGDTYQQLGADAFFIDGNDNRSDIPLQLKLTGVSSAIPPDTYTTTIIYTYLGP